LAKKWRSLVAFEKNKKKTLAYRGTRIMNFFLILKREETFLKNKNLKTAKSEAQSYKIF
jgi:hypothetical protein